MIENKNSDIGDDIFDEWPTWPHLPAKMMHIETWVFVVHCLLMR